MPTAIAWFTDISSDTQGRTSLVLVGGATAEVPFTLDEFAAMWEDAMRGDPVPTTPRPTAPPRP